MKSVNIIIVLLLTFVSVKTYSQNLDQKKEFLPTDSKTNCYIRYQYFPNLESYFDNLENVYYFKENNEWKTAKELPLNYGGYSMYNKLKVNITDYDDDKPFQYLKLHKKLFPYNSKGRFTKSPNAS